MATKLMNSAIMTRAGTYDAYEISRDDFVRHLQDGAFESYIGYSDTADFIERISGKKIAVNRAASILSDGDLMLVCRLKYRVTNPADKGKYIPTDDDYEFLLCRYSSANVAIRN